MTLHWQIAGAGEETHSPIIRPINRTAMNRDQLIFPFIAVALVRMYRLGITPQSGIAPSKE
ncbi:hypothetical protein SAMN05421821_10311 [Mucilaginibacter lappiensis]|uniref:Uncharacterized protein n=1 Tax=Mucilaginibacter lappiensis TaxID=354630 RepID=A0ABR6PG80_9SPHI|nr:hypothetical protein [Mucilaginibacter lappiensis]SIQ61789.1 hypothetical protein SAMN05421821_10311 [Mucilaginibacter lappiensis]